MIAMNVRADRRKKILSVAWSEKGPEKRYMRILRNLQKANFSPGVII
jgi:hypothetical protein